MAQTKLRTPIVKRAETPRVFKPEYTLTPPASVKPPVGTQAFYEQMDTLSGMFKDPGVARSISELGHSRRLEEHHQEAIGIDDSWFRDLLGAGGFLAGAKFGAQTGAGAGSFLGPVGSVVGGVVGGIAGGLTGSSLAQVASPSGARGAYKTGKTIIGESSELTGRGLDFLGNSMDQLDGAAIVKSGVLSLQEDDREFVDSIKKAYGMGDKEFEPTYFSDIRENMGIDLGTIPNMAADFIGEMAVSPSVHNIRWMSKTKRQGATAVTKKLTRLGAQDNRLLPFVNDGVAKRTSDIILDSAGNKNYQKGLTRFRDMIRKDRNLRHAVFDKMKNTDIYYSRTSAEKFETATKSLFDDIYNDVMGEVSPDLMRVFQAKTDRTGDFENMADYFRTNDVKTFNDLPKHYREALEKISYNQKANWNVARESHAFSRRWDQVDTMFAKGLWFAVSPPLSILKNHRKLFRALKGLPYKSDLVDSMAGTLFRNHQRRRVEDIYRKLRGSDVDFDKHYGEQLGRLEYQAQRATRMTEINRVNEELEKLEKLKKRLDEDARKLRKRKKSIEDRLFGSFDFEVEGMKITKKNKRLFRERRKELQERLNMRVLSLEERNHVRDRIAQIDGAMELYNYIDKVNKMDEEAFNLFESMKSVTETLRVRQERAIDNFERYYQRNPDEPIRVTNRNLQSINRSEVDDMDKQFISKDASGNERYYLDEKDGNERYLLHDNTEDLWWISTESTEFKTYNSLGRREIEKLALESEFGASIRDYDNLVHSQLEMLEKYNKKRRQSIPNKEFDDLLQEQMEQFRRNPVVKYLSDSDRFSLETSAKKGNVSKYKKHLMINGDDVREAHLKLIKEDGFLQNRGSQIVPTLVERGHGSKVRMDAPGGERLRYTLQSSESTPEQIARLEEIMTNLRNTLNRDLQQDSKPIEIINRALAKGGEVSERELDDVRRFLSDETWNNVTSAIEEADLSGKEIFNLIEGVHTGKDIEFVRGETFMETGGKSAVVARSDISTKRILRELGVPDNIFQTGRYSRTNIRNIEDGMEFDNILKRNLGREGISEEEAIRETLRLAERDPDYKWAMDELKTVMGDTIMSNREVLNSLRDPETFFALLERVQNILYNKRVNKVEDAMKPGGEFQIDGENIGRVNEALSRLLGDDYQNLIYEGQFSTEYTLDNRLFLDNQEMSPYRFMNQDIVPNEIKDEFNELFEKWRGRNQDPEDFFKQDVVKNVEQGRDYVRMLQLQDQVIDNYAHLQINKDAVLFSMMDTVNRNDVDLDELARLFVGEGDPEGMTGFMKLVNSYIMEDSQAKDMQNFLQETNDHLRSFSHLSKFVKSLTDDPEIGRLLGEEFPNNKHFGPMMDVIKNLDNTKKGIFEIDETSGRPRATKSELINRVNNAYGADRLDARILNRIKDTISERYDDILEKGADSEFANTRFYQDINSHNIRNIDESLMALRDTMRDNIDRFIQEGELSDIQHATASEDLKFLEDTRRHLMDYLRGPLKNANEMNRSLRSRLFSNDEVARLNNTTNVGPAKLSREGAPVTMKLTNLQNYNTRTKRLMNVLYDSDNLDWKNKNEVSAFRLDRSLKSMWPEIEDMQSKFKRQLDEVDNDNTLSTLEKETRILELSRTYEQDLKNRAIRHLESAKSEFNSPVNENLDEVIEQVRNINLVKQPYLMDDTLRRAIGRTPEEMNTRFGLGIELPSSFERTPYGYTYDETTNAILPRANDSNIAFRLGKTRKDVQRISRKLGEIGMESDEMPEFMRMYNRVNKKVMKRQKGLEYYNRVLEGENYDDFIEELAQDMGAHEGNLDVMVENIKAALGYKKLFDDADSIGKQSMITEQVDVSRTVQNLYEELDGIGDVLRDMQPKAAQDVIDTFTAKYMHPGNRAEFRDEILEDIQKLEGDPKAIDDLQFFLKTDKWDTEEFFQKLYRATGHYDTLTERTDLPGDVTRRLDSIRSEIRDIEVKESMSLSDWQKRERLLKEKETIENDYWYRKQEKAFPLDDRPIARRIRELRKQRDDLQDLLDEELEEIATKYGIENYHRAKKFARDIEGIMRTEKLSTEGSLQSAKNRVKQALREQGLERFVSDSRIDELVEQFHRRMDEFLQGVGVHHFIPDFSRQFDNLSQFNVRNQSLNYIGEFRERGYRALNFTDMSAKDFNDIRSAYFMDLKMELQKELKTGLEGGRHTKAYQLGYEHAENVHQATTMSLAKGSSLEFDDLVKTFKNGHDLNRFMIDNPEYKLVFIEEAAPSARVKDRSPFYQHVEEGVDEIRYKGMYTHFALSDDGRTIRSKTSPDVTEPFRMGQRQAFEEGAYDNPPVVKEVTWDSEQALDDMMKLQHSETQNIHLMSTENFKKAKKFSYTKAKLPKALNKYLTGFQRVQKMDMLLSLAWNPTNFVDVARKNSNIIEGSWGFRDYIHFLGEAQHYYMEWDHWTRQKMSRSHRIDNQIEDTLREIDHLKQFERTGERARQISRYMDEIKKLEKEQKYINSKSTLDYALENYWDDVDINKILRGEVSEESVPYHAYRKIRKSNRFKRASIEEKQRLLEEHLEDYKNMLKVTEEFQGTSASTDISEYMRQLDLDSFSEFRGRTLSNKAVQWLADENPFVKANMGIATRIEQVGRLHGYMLDRFAYGRTEDTALHRSLRRHFDYSDKSMAELWAKLFIPFIQFPTRNALYWAEELQSGYQSRRLNAKLDALWGDYDMEENEYAQWARMQGYIPVGEKLVKIGDSRLQALRFLNNPRQEITNRMNPMIRESVEALRGNKSVVDSAISATPFVRRLPEAVRRIQERHTKPLEASVAPSLFSSIYRRDFNRYNNRYQVYRNLYDKYGRYRYRKDADPHYRIQSITYQQRRRQWR